MEAHIYGSSSWETVVYYNTSFNSGTSSIEVTGFQIRKGSSTTQASTSYGVAVTFNIAGTSFSTTQNFNVPKGGDWSGLYEVSKTITGLTPGSSQSFQITSAPWPNMKGSGSGSVAGYPTYTISYNANGGSGAPGAQTKTWGSNLTLSSTVPTRTNYQFLGWSTSNTATYATYYSPDHMTYTSNSGATLYAVWKILQPTFTTYPTVSTTETTIAYTRMAADISGTTFTYKINNGSWVTANANGGTITGRTPGTNNTITFRATANNLTRDYSLPANNPNYPYIQNFTAGTVNAGSNRTIEFYNPLKRTLRITAKTNNLTVLSTEYIETPNGSLPLNINITATSNALGANSSSGTVIYKMQYLSGSTVLAESSASEAIQITAAAGAPSVDSSKINGFITYVDNNSTSTAVTTANSVLLQGYSKIKITPSDTATDPFTPLTPASITSYTIKINNGAAASMTKGTAYYQGTNNTIVTAAASSVAIPSTANSISITVTATDTRGFSNEATRTITVTPYTKPTVAIQSVVRADGYGTDVALSSTWGWCAAFNSTARGNGKVWLWYKTVGTSGDGTKYATAITTNPQTIPSIFSSNQAYLVRLQAVDALSQTTYTDWATIPLGNPIFFIDEYQNGVGINCYPDGEGAYIGGNRVVAITSGTSAPSASAGSIGDIYIQIS